MLIASEMVISPSPAKVIFLLLPEMALPDDTLIVRLPPLCEEMVAGPLKEMAFANVIAPTPPSNVVALDMVSVLFPRAPLALTINLPAFNETPLEKEFVVFNASVPDPDLLSDCAAIAPMIKPFEDVVIESAAADPSLLDELEPPNAEMDPFTVMFGAFNEIVPASPPT